MFLLFFYGTEILKENSSLRQVQTTRSTSKQGHILFFLSFFWPENIYMDLRLVGWDYKNFQ
jgi:uncharacterized membrane protein